ncbi:MAG: preprotein translocase subunit SecG [Candidatus Babeliales bacterium]|nr:preprotein translocase subunit SecG [Candidatus Babeliales bacterium]
MLNGLISFAFSSSCILLILMILIQKGKGSMGLGQMGGQSQMLFGSSGGQDIMQKTTWVLGVILIFGSLGIALLKSRQHQVTGFAPQEQTMPINNAQEPIEQE